VRKLAAVGHPHHDGSPMYVSDPDPALGSDVDVRVWVPHADDGAPAADRVYLRSVRDGDPRVTEADVESTDDAGSWWRARLHVHNPLTSYRFLLSGGRDGYRWLNGTGVHARDVTDAADFRLSTLHRLPDWVLDQVGYQVFPDRFERSSPTRPAPAWAVPAAWDDPVIHQGPQVSRQWFGGTLDGVTSRLDHVSSLGATLLYLTPVFEGRSNHRYDAVSFDHVDPALGGDRALKQMLDAAHRRGLRVIGDLTTNHTGDEHEWFHAARRDPASAERGFYRFDADGRYEAWQGIPSMPKLDHASVALRHRLYEGPDSAAARWLQHGLDGWRIDVANMTGRLGADDYAHEVARILRATMADIRSDSWLLAEHFHDASLDLTGTGWHGTMDYAGFTRPVWTWLNGGGVDGPGQRHDLTCLSLPVDIPVMPGDAVVTTMREVHAAMPWHAWAGSTSHLDSHDTPRFRTVTGGGTSGWFDAAGDGRDRHLVGVALQMTMPSVPVVFMGDEIGLTATDGEHARTPYPWDRQDEWDELTLHAYRTWVKMRHRHVALRRGGLRWVSIGVDSLTYLREHPDERVLVHVARADHGAVELPLRGLGLRSADQLAVIHGEPVASPRPGTVGLPRSGPGAHAYLLEP